MSLSKFSLILALSLMSTIASGCAPRVAPVSDTNLGFDPRGLITVSDARVQESLKAILEDEDNPWDEFHRIQNWVAGHVSYDTNVTEYWQRPTETIDTGKGDCKDYSTLLCSLWRAWGVPASDVYVAIGQSPSGRRHAFVIQKYLTGKWQVSEPQVGGIIVSELTAVDTAEKYAITFLFNDAAYVNQPSLIYQVVRGGVTVTPLKPAGKGPLPVINSFTADGANIAAGTTVLLNWNVSGATHINIDQGVGEVSPIGVAQVNPTDSIQFRSQSGLVVPVEYRLVAMNSSGSAQASVIVRVIQKATSTTPAPDIPAIDKPASFLIGFEGWYSDIGVISTANAGQRIAARISLKGGSPGQYWIRIWRDVNRGNDEIVSQTAFTYDGKSAAQEIFFAPSYFIGEADTRGYRIDLLCDGQQVWVMPNAYPPRLTVIPKPSTGSLAVNFAGWYIGVDSVSAAKTGQEVSGGITLSGGSGGKYVLNARRDTAGLSDEIMNQLTFDYDGTSALQQITFSPTSATNESGTRGYYLDLYQDGKFLWSLSGKYPPRLTVTRGN
ncbi:MAG: transglutaminase-like domain-containing protein [Dehalococcoidia bacterium]|nr:transglutaminase-like domain-containing protein [Dehalococcoidia bacterium]MDD5493799.1 transglutaminase-like domain-containing protein [Dehalococcoidia bacterium]